MAGKRNKGAEDAGIGRDIVDPESAEEFKVQDRRRWAAGEEADPEPAEPRVDEAPDPSVIDAFRQRAEQAETKLLEYMEAFRGFKHEQEQFRERTTRDLERRVELRFGDLVGELVGSADDLEIALSHIHGVEQAEPLAQGVRMALTRFLGALERQGVERIEPQDAPFDPNEAEAMRVDPVDSPERDGVVTEVLSRGYRLGDRIVRAARVAVGRFTTDS